MLPAWLLLGLWMQAAGSGAVPTLTVADAINNPGKYAGRTVAVEGRLLVSDEVTVLSGSGCETRMSPMNKPFACAIRLVLPSCNSAESRCTPALMDVLRIIRSQRLSREDERITVRLAGTLTAPRQVLSRNVPPLAPGLPEGKYVESGFGHMGAFPAQLSVIEGSIVSQVERPANSKRN